MGTRIDDAIRSHRVVAEETKAGLSEDYIQKVVAENPGIFDLVLESIPAEWTDTSKSAAVITAAAVAVAENTGSIARSLGGKIVTATCFRGISTLLNATMDYSLDCNYTVDNLAENLTLSIVNAATSVGIEVALTAIGITGASGVLFGVAASTRAYAFLDKTWDIWLDPHTILKHNIDENTATILTALTPSEYFFYHWGRLEKWDEWTFQSEKTNLKIKYNKINNEFYLNKPQIDENTFNLILEKVKTAIPTMSSTISASQKRSFSRILPRKLPWQNSI